MLDEAGDYLFHYTKLSTALESILPERTFRLSPFSTMRDPRESHQWVAAATHWGELDDVEELFWGFNRRLMDSKDSFKVMSLTRDEQREPPFEIFGRGFAHPRLWEHYGGDHAGVCLCFDRTALIERLEEGAIQLGDLRHGDVVYEDAPIAATALDVNLNDVSANGIDLVLNQLLNEYSDELFFKKLRDWETECEYRFVLRTDHREPVTVSVADALQAAVLGPLVSDSYLPSLRELCIPHGISLARLRWWNGRPLALATE